MYLDIPEVGKELFVVLKLRAFVVAVVEGFKK